MPDMGLDLVKMKARREKLGISQTEAAERAGIGNRARWADIETGKRANISLETLDKIAAALQVKPSYLLKD